MNNSFLKNFFEIRDETLKDIQNDLKNWNKFIYYWSKILDDYSIDNVLNLYSYNSSGRLFMTFDDWNSEKIGRRIKPKSKGIPIMGDRGKIYVFDIRQTYGKDYKRWNYNHYIDEFILKDYQSNLDIKNDESKTINDNYYNVFYEISLNQIMKNYKTMSTDEVEFIAKTMTSLFLAKTNFNIYKLPTSYEMLEEMKTDDILKCMQIANKETNIIYNDFVKKATLFEKVQDYIQSNVLAQYKSNELLNEIDKQNFITNIENESKINDKILDYIYNYYNEKYNLKFFKKEIQDANSLRISNEEDKKRLYKEENNYFAEDSNNEIVPNNDGKQISLFAPAEEELANKICDIFNSFDTKYKNTFVVNNVELQQWEHIKSKKRNLTILLSSPIVDFGENAFSYFNSDKTDEEILNNGIATNAFIQSLYKDKDFSIIFSPNLIHIYWSNFDEKQFDINIPNEKLVDQKEIDNKELEKIDDNVSSKVSTDFTYKVTTAEIIPTHDGVKTSVVEEHTYNKDGEEIENDYPPINYHISDDKIDTSFGAKSRFENNIEAIKILKKLEKEDRNATKDEQEILSQYVGWGGIADAFDERKESWNKEREELKSLLTEEEYKSAAHSTLSSFYTPNVAIDGIYKSLKKFGFENGNILEPSCGIGNFFGRLPSEFNKSKLYGIELDNISGRIAKKLYPNAKIELKGYEESQVSDELFDIAVGNVPFGTNTVYDRRYKDKFLIHDYFFQKTLDKVRDGGIIAFITTDGTLDKKDIRVREYIAKRAEFLGAIRLPNNTFIGNANAKVTSDIIFLKKRDELKQDVSEENWLYTSEYVDGVTINNYYIDHPEMMLGKMELHSTGYGFDNTLNPIDEDINVLMEKALENLPENIYEKVSFNLNENNDYEILEADETVKNNAFTIKNINDKDIIYQRVFSSLIPYEIQDGMIAKRIIGLCKLKNALREVFNIQLRDGTDEELRIAQEKLSNEYDEFYKKYGYINDSANARAFDNDPDYYLLTSIENKIGTDEENDKPI